MVKLSDEMTKDEQVASRVKNLDHDIMRQWQDKEFANVMTDLFLRMSEKTGKQRFINASNMKPEYHPTLDVNDLYWLFTSCASDILNDRKRGLWNKISASTAAATLGRVKSVKKSKSSAENGRKGGRPKKENIEKVGE